MTNLKLDSKMNAAAAAAIEPHIDSCYARPGARLMAIIELTKQQRLVPEADSDKKASVTMRITHMEIPKPGTEAEHAVRQAQQALYVQRTAQGTLDEEENLVLSKDTLEHCAGLLGAIETARLRVCLSHWARYAARIVSLENITISEIRHELDTIAAGLRAGMDGAHLEDESDG
jgi:hypothetical protein